MEGLGYFGPGELPQFDGGFFDMPHGDATEWAFDQFKEKAVAAGGAITDELVETFRDEVQKAMGLSKDNLAMMYEEEDYI